MNFSETEQLFVSRLQALYGQEEALAIAFYVIEHVCGVNRTRYQLIKKEPVAENMAAVLLQKLAELETGKPVQYVLGQTVFFGLNIQVNAAVLIPRPETEELVAWVLDDVKAARRAEPGLHILDIGTGSGCIPIAVKKYVPQAAVYATDISAAALSTASANAMQNGTDIRFTEADILNFAAFPELHRPYNIIISNPPYITHAEKQQMHLNVTAYEPHSALFVPDEDAMLFYRSIAEFAANYLQPGGLLYFEINEHYGGQTLKLLTEAGFKNCLLRKDIAGKDRMVRAEWPSDK